ncbi:DNA cytosine methyltransferase [Mesorhizobium sp. GbtcB19]|uniref:DNA cytosine methyltransferase n=1 Tax=Mesorhizobium sp. GbtcB19 TaxID=2824764 RepID=UPI0020C5D72E|nr:DNA cytosine methyltransferase [Mesorhizobium sp. GbtcB19]
MLTYGSVCSGIEAASVAWEPLGWRPAFFSEIEAFPSAVLAHHYGSNLPGEPLSKNGVPNHGDFTKIPGDAGPVDLLVGGTPCQSFSVAGKRLGLDDPRGNLALEYVRLAKRLGARWVVWENVPGVFSSADGRDFADFLGFLAGRRIGVPRGGWQNAGIVAGIPGSYGLAWRVLDAQYVRVDGYPRAVPQRRRRVFVVGYSGDWRRAAAILFEPEGMQGNPAPLSDRAFNCFDTGIGSLDRSSKDNVIWVGNAFRLASSREIERAFGFPDDYTNITHATKVKRYDALGNSMAVPVMRWIGQRIDLMERLVCEGRI